MLGAWEALEEFEVWPETAGIATPAESVAMAISALYLVGNSMSDVSTGANRHFPQNLRLTSWVCVKLDMRQGLRTNTGCGIGLGCARRGNPLRPVIGHRAARGGLQLAIL
jgi:hypothetical protein